MTFWILSISLSLAAAAAIAAALLRRTGGAAGNPDIGIYRDQLAEVDRDLARGLISEQEAERLRTEVARRILAADRTGPSSVGEAPGRLSRAAALVVLATVVGGALGLYTRLGAPGYDDQPLSKRIAEAEERRLTRPSQAEIEAMAAQTAAPRPQVDPDFLELMEKLRRTLEDRPDDLRGYRLLARNEAALGNHAAAARAQEHILTLLDEPAARDYSDLAEYYVSAAAGYVSPEAEAAILAALQRDETDPRARYFAGLLYIQIGRADVAFRFWRGLLEEGPESAPWMAPIRAEISALAAMAGVDYTPPPPRAAPASPATGGPTAEDMAAAAEMSPEDRVAMIQGMVEGLSERLAIEGGTAPEWAQLIRALGVLGQTARAEAIWAEAQQVFGASPADLAIVRAAAAQAGLDLGADDGGATE